jgi:hypothetical protein
MRRRCETVDYIPSFTLSVPEAPAQDVEKKKAEPKLRMFFENALYASYHKSIFSK